MKLKDVLIEFQEYHNRIAVWEELLQHLRQFLSVVGADPENEITSNFGSSGKVPEDTVLKVIKEIVEGPLADLEVKIFNLEDTIVDESKGKLSTEGTQTGSSKKISSPKACRGRPSRVVGKSMPTGGGDG